MHQSTFCLPSQSFLTIFFSCSEELGEVSVRSMCETRRLVTLVVTLTDEAIVGNPTDPDKTRLSKGKRGEPRVGGGWVREEAP